MKKALKVELSRAFCNRSFVLALVAGLLISGAQLVLVPLQYGFADIWSNWRMGLGGNYPPSLYNSWIGQTPHSVVTAVFYYALPLLACIPFADSLATDLTSRYAVHKVSRSGRAAYFASKSVAIALSSCLVVFVPLALNVLLTACCVPALPPEPAAGTFFVSSSAMLADLYYAFPLAHIAVFIALASLFAGAFGLFSAAASFFSSNRFVVVLLPFALCMGVNFVLQGTAFAGFSPTNMLLPYQPFPSIFWLVCLVALLLWGLFAFILWFRGRKYEDL